MQSEAAEGGRNDLVMTAAWTKEIRKITILAAKALGRVMILAAAHASDPALDATMNLFKMVVQVGVGPVPDALPQHAVDRPWGFCQSSCQHI